MITTNPIYENMFNSVARQFVGRVELLEGSTLIDVFEHDGALISFTIDKTSDNTKFFGYGISQVLTVKLRDKDRSINIQKGQYLQAAYGIGTDYVYNCTMFIVDEIIRDEKTNELTVKALDPIYTASGFLVKDLVLPEQFTLRVFAIACGTLLGMPVNFINIPDYLMDITYTKEMVNFKENDTIRNALDNLAEMFGAIYYFCNNWNITFKRFDYENDPVLIIDKSKYFELSAKTAVTLTNIMSVTELGDNITTTSGIPGETQYLRENAFLVLRTDIDGLLVNLLSAVQGLTIQQITCKHRGDFRLEMGDKIGFVTKDNQIVVSYLLTDSITYNGGLVGNTVWEYAANINETESNPTTLGEVVKTTYAKVDKVNQEIELLTRKLEESDVGILTEEVASLKVTTDSITQEVARVESDANTAITSLANKVSQTMTADDITFLISEEVGNGVSSITTDTGYVFDNTGLTVSKSGSEMTTQITEDGMTVARNGSVMLTANNTGVDAINLRATTFLIIGETSRFENYYDSSLGYRTGCFWVGN